MLRDDGLVLDDGTCWRISENEYFITTSTAQAAKVMAWLEELLQTRWTNLKVHITTVSEQWAAISVAGPNARELLNECVENRELIKNENLPFMGFVELKFLNGINCRLARISFSGELAFEVYIPSNFANSVMDLIWKKANKYDGCLYGLECLALCVSKKVM